LTTSRHVVVTGRVWRIVSSGQDHQRWRGHSVTARGRESGIDLVRAGAASPVHRNTLVYLLDVIEPLVGAEGRAETEGQVMELTCVQGDITDQRVDAIVNAANSSLLGGGGVDGAIHRKGGSLILRECQDIRRTSYPDGLPVGQAVATSAGDLRANWVIHTVGPVYAKGEDRSAQLASCYRESLRVADELGVSSIAFPAISTGVYRYPLDEAARIAVDAVRQADTKVSDVRFVLFDQEAYDAFAAAVG